MIDYICSPPTRTYLFLAPDCMFQCNVNHLPSAIATHKENFKDK